MRKALDLAVFISFILNVTFLCALNQVHGRYLAYLGNNDHIKFTPAGITRYSYLLL
jgi:hypothetical protein